MSEDETQNVKIAHTEPSSEIKKDSLKDDNGASQEEQSENIDDPVVIEETQDTDNASENEIKEVENKIRNFFQMVSQEEITTVLEKRNAILGTEEFRARVEIPGSYESLLAIAASQYSMEAERILKSIAAIEDKSKFSNKLIQEGKVILTSFITPRRAPSGGKALSGKEARIEFAIKTGKAKRIALFNSGFSVDLNTPNLVALNDFFTRAHDETNAYGREFGANFFYFNSLLIKEAIVELIMPLMLGSTLKNWNRPGVLLRNLKLYDLKIILNGLASLMFPDGFAYTHICTNPSGMCTYSEEILIDLVKLFHTNWMLLSDANIDHMKQQNEVSYEKIQEYQKNLGFEKTLRYGNIELELCVPSVEDYLIYGRKFNADLTKSNFADSTTDIYRSLLFCYYQTYTPFVKSVTLYDEKNEKDIFSEDPDIIADQLLELQSKDPDRKVAADIQAFIESTEITQICYPAAPCPKCGYLPKDKHYHTVDPENNFFILSLKRLQQN